MIMEADAQGSSSSYYSILGVSSDSSIEEIRRAYRKLAMQWHPDRWTRTPSLLGEAKRKFQRIQEAYSVLSDPMKRTMYDAGLYDPQDEEDEGLSDFVEELVSLMAQVKREDKAYNMEELQTMFTELAEGFNFTEMAQGFESPPLYCGPSALKESHCSKRRRLDTEAVENGRSNFHVPDLKLYETKGYCS